jgi:hypothetical protein
MIQQILLFTGFISSLPQPKQTHDGRAWAKESEPTKPLSSKLGLKEQAGSD